MGARRLQLLQGKRDAALYAYVVGDIEKLERDRRMADIDREIAAEKRAVAADRARAALPMSERRRWAGAAVEGGRALTAPRDRHHPSSDDIARAQRHLWARRFRSVADAAKHRWACEVPETSPFLEKVHIRPVRYGGEDAPWNLLLLCLSCHAEQDDEASRVVQLRWLREHARAPETYIRMLEARAQ